MKEKSKKAKSVAMKYKDLRQGIVVMIILGSRYDGRRGTIIDISTSKKGLGVIRGSNPC